MFGLGGRLAPADRIARAVVGVGLIGAGIVLGVLGAPSVWVAVLVAGVGAALVAEAGLNYCPAARIWPWNRAGSQGAAQGS
jgi:hypothetical protein